MPVADIEHTKVMLRYPSQLLNLTRICRVNWNNYCRRKHNGLTQQQQQQLLSEFYSMKAVVRHLIPEEPAIERYTEISQKTVEKAFGEDAWEVLNKSLVYLGELRKFANPPTPTNFGSS